MTNLLDTTVKELRASLPVLLTVAEAAKVGHCSPSGVRRAIEGGRLPFNQRGENGTVYVPRDAVLTWAFSLEVRTKEHAPEPPRPKKARQDEQREAGAQRKRRAPLRVVPRGTQAWSKDEMLRFASGYTG